MSETKKPLQFARTPSSWDPQDDILLRHLKEQQKLGWKEIASHFQNRTPNACQFRWRRLRSGSLKTEKKPRSMSAVGSRPRSTSFTNHNLKAGQRRASMVVTGERRASIVVTGTSRRGSVWMQDEDELLLIRRSKELSFDEVSILLPDKTEDEIWERIDELESVRAESLPVTGHAPLVALTSTVSPSVTGQEVTPGSVTVPLVSRHSPKTPVPGHSPLLKGTFHDDVRPYDDMKMLLNYTLEPSPQRSDSLMSHKTRESTSDSSVDGDDYIK